MIIRRKKGRELNKNQDGNKMMIHLCLHISMPQMKSLPFSAAQQLSDIESGGIHILESCGGRAAEIALIRELPL